MASILPTLQFIARHPLSSRRPFSAYWRYARWQVESRLRDEVEFHWIEGSKLIVRNGMTGATGNIYCGLHEFVDMAFLLHLLRPGDLFVDVGANIGSYTVLASAVCGARSIAIEPDPGTVQSLKRNVEINRIGDRVTVIEAAIGAAAGMVRFTVGKDTTNRVAAASDEATREVKVRTLDDILANTDPVLIKMDVEGYEPQVIAGALATLAKQSLAAVITETTDPMIESVMKNCGFVRATYSPIERSIVAGGGRVAQYAVRQARSGQGTAKDGPSPRCRGHRLMNYHQKYATAYVNDHTEWLRRCPLCARGLGSATP
ncbi:FkbM family methyltransferase [Hyphomicrobium zavarzinii]|uniref:FkbM family methyltransferase n=1 Tax=Hyphomicrobium zavarzinii TaxID=48292 RepID=UPI0012EB574E|nr:FkbM family methyltransferase [Hyphomicrobium zavarzinii]